MCVEARDHPRATVPRITLHLAIHLSGAQTRARWNLSWTRNTEPHNQPLAMDGIRNTPNAQGRDNERTECKVLERHTSFSIYNDRQTGAYYHRTLPLSAFLHVHCSVVFLSSLNALVLRLRSFSRFLRACWKNGFREQGYAFHSP